MGPITLRSLKRSVHKLVWDPLSSSKIEVGSDIVDTLEVEGSRVEADDSKTSSLSTQDGLIKEAFEVSSSGQKGTLEASTSAQVASRLSNSHDGRYESELWEQDWESDEEDWRRAALKASASAQVNSHNGRYDAELWEQNWETEEEDYTSDDDEEDSEEDSESDEEEFEDTEDTFDELKLEEAEKKLSELELKEAKKKLGELKLKEAEKLDEPELEKKEEQKLDKTCDYISAHVTLSTDDGLLNLKTLMYEIPPEKDWTVTWTV